MYFYVFYVIYYVDCCICVYVLCMSYKCIGVRFNVGDFFLVKDSVFTFILITDKHKFIVVIPSVLFCVDAWF